MDKKALQEQFEAIAIQNCWNINKYPAGWDGHGDDEYADDFVSGAWWAFQHQQAKVEELDTQLLAYKKFALNMGKKIESEALRTSAKKWNMTTAAEKKLIQDLWDVFNNEADEALSVEQALKGEGQ
ncbi:hypothetical protein [Acinetobacter geminorum]|uniref:hypothetical protein n=1 Tax=Acinetobacter geminorum TaxID=2730922 RepID=UPI003AF42426